MLLKLLIVISEYKIYALTLADKSFSKSQKRAFHAFIRKYYRNFYNSKNRNKPVYALKVDLLGDFVVNKFNGLPVIIHNSYSKASKTLLESRELVYDEYLDSILEDIHYTTVNGVKSCVPGGVNALSKAFNAKFYFMGVFKKIGSFLKACKSCRVNTSLPMTQAPPPKPIRSFRPHERIQYDLVDLASKKKRSFMKVNPWGFRYILSIKCCFSKFCWLFPLQTKSAPSIHKVMQFLFDVEGAPDILQSDNGKEFVNPLIRQLSNEFGFRIIRGRPYTPKHQGQVENLNKTVKAYLRKLLQSFDKEEQGKVWPLLLPGIANKINKSYHSTIDDIPFRVYRNRDANSIGFTIVPEDLAFGSHTSLDTSIDTDEDLSSDCEDEEGEDCDDAEVGTDCLNDETSSNFSVNEIMQSCLGSSLSKSFFGNRFDNEAGQDDNDLPEESENDDDDIESAFSTSKFSSSLFSISQKRFGQQLRTLQSTEFTIHRNIERDLKNCPGDKFSIGDAVLVKNPALKESKGKHASRDPFAPINLIAEVIEILPGGMYKLKLLDGSDFYQKNVFEGEMVLFRQNETNLSSPSGNNDAIASKDRKYVLDAISDFALQVRRTVYKSKEKRPRQDFDSSYVDDAFSTYFEILDCGVLAELYAGQDEAKQNEMHAFFTKGMLDLKATGFPFFLYGSVAWERKRKVWLSDRLLSFLSLEGSHKCTDCFDDLSSLCQHPCCQQRALNFLERCGMKLPSSKKKQNDKTPKTKPKQAKSTKKCPNSNSVDARPPASKQKRAKKGGKAFNLNEDNFAERSFETISSTVSADTNPLPAHLHLARQAQQKCIELLSNDIDDTTKYLIRSVKLKIDFLSELPNEKVKNVTSNLQYFMNVMFVACPSALEEHLTSIHFGSISGISLKMQMQGSTNLCGLCALNNTIPGLDAKPEALHRIADNTWLVQSLNQDITNDLEKCRSLSGDYNIDVLINAAQAAGYEYSQMNNKLLSFFRNASPDDLTTRAPAMFSDLMKALDVRPGDRLLLNNATAHFVALLFLEGNLLVLDSLKGPCQYVDSEALLYLWQLVYESIGLYSFSPKPSRFILISDDDPSDSTSQTRDTYAVFQILQPDSEIDISIEISSVFKHVTAGDLRCLDGSRCINDAVVAAVCQAVNKTSQDVVALDSLVTAKLLKDPSWKHINKRRPVVEPGKKLVLCPVNQDNHWWLASIDISARTYTVLDSLARDRSREISLLLRALANNDYSEAVTFSNKKIVVPSQGTNNFQCGVFTMCFLVSQAAGQQPTFTIFDMDHVRERVAWCIANGKELELASPSLWEGELCHIVVCFCL